MQKSGFRLNLDFQRPDPALAEAFRDIPVANIDDCMGRIAAVDACLRPLNKARLLGPAFTVKAPAGDNLIFHKALDAARPGDILVIAAGGSMSRSLCGEIMASYAMMRGLGGFVIDGCVRDIDALSEMDFPVYARGITPNGPYKNGPGEMNVPVSVAGQVICPGDILVGDGDGLLVIRPAEAAALAKQAKAVVAMEAGQLSDIVAGKGLDRSWIDKKLAELGYELS